MQRRGFLALLAAAPLGLSACGRRFSTDFGTTLPPGSARGWRVARVEVRVPETLTVSERNVMAPRADIVWHGDPFGDRRRQVADVVRGGIEQGTIALQGDRPVIIGVTVKRFHAITPRAVSAAPSGVHSIEYAAQVFDATTALPITGIESFRADMEALTGPAAVVAAQEGQTQKVRIQAHIARVTAAWLGIGADVRGRFLSFGR